jgi:hypothetical protein
VNDPQLIPEIERLEEWFRGVYSPIAGPDRSGIRRAVRIALEEQRLSAQLAEAAPEGLADRAKARVRDAVRESTRTGRSRALRLRWWLGSGLSAAAALGLAVVALRPRTESVDGVETISLVSAFEQFDDDDFDTELSQLREALLDDSFARGDGDWIESFEESEDGHDGA